MELVRLDYGLMCRNDSGMCSWQDWIVGRCVGIIPTCGVGEAGLWADV